MTAVAMRAFERLAEVATIAIARSIRERPSGCRRTGPPQIERAARHGASTPARCREAPKRTTTSDTLKLNCRRPHASQDVAANSVGTE